MRGRWLAACAALGAATFLANSGQAAPIADDYIGFNSHGHGDVIAGSGLQANFQINSIDVSKSGADLKVVVSTSYNPNSSGALGTGLGDLFFGTDMSKAPAYGAASATDAYSAGRFNYVFSIRNDDYPGANGTGTLHALRTDGTDVKTAYGAGTVRTGQAVEFLGNSKPATGITGSWTLDVAQDTLTFLITNAANTFGSTFFIAWAMTCANDIIYANIAFPPPNNPPGDVPLPAGFILMGSVLLGAGGVARWRKRRMVQAA